MKTDGYIFKDSWLKYIFYGILLCVFICLWISLDSFPFGDKGAVGLFIFIMVFIMILAFPIWGIIKHPNRLIIDSDGLHCQTIHHFGLIITSFIHGIKFNGSSLNG